MTLGLAWIWLGEWPTWLALLGGAIAILGVAIVNLFGELWERGSPRFDAALSHSGVRLHLYGKRGARAGRKMGHLSAIGATPTEALERVTAAFAELTENQE